MWREIEGRRITEGMGRMGESWDGWVDSGSVGLCQLCVGRLVWSERKG